MRTRLQRTPGSWRARGRSSDRFSGCDPRRSENIECNRVVTGVTWVDGELSHGTWTGDQAASIRERAKCWNGSKCRAGRAPS